MNTQSKTQDTNFKAVIRANVGRRSGAYGQTAKPVRTLTGKKREYFETDGPATCLLYV